MKQAYSVMKAWCKATQRRCGFGHDAAIDRLHAMKGMLHARETVGWRGMGRFINACQGQYGVSTDLYKIHMEVMRTLLEEARQGRIDLYSKFPRAHLEELANISNTLKHYAEIDQENITLPNESFYFKVDDVISATIKTCEALKGSENIFLKKYADTVCLLLARDDRVAHQVQAGAENFAELCSKFTQTTNLHQVKRGHSPLFIELMKKCEIPPVFF